MAPNDFSRGSEWRRWDLHIHTPETKKNDQFEGSTLDEKWEKFYESIKNYPHINDIAVIGITDYLSIDNYEWVVKDWKDRPPSIKLIIPNIEIRLQPISHESPLNAHVLCNPDFVSEFEKRFFPNLKVKVDNREFNASKEQLIDLGRKEDNEKNKIDDTAALKEGINKFIPTFDSFREVFEHDKELKENIIIGVSNKTNDGASGIDKNHSYDNENGTNSMETSKNEVYKFADVIFSANEGDINYFLGKKENCPPEKVIKNCGSLKPCIHGCDAHKNIKIFEPDQKRYCWIKADPTFEGLKQIIYEPEDRVRIQESKPETKRDYFVIDRVEYDDSDFQEEPIYFNDKLTCIIGGKSTGKSILIQNLARTVDEKETEKRIEKSGNRTKDVRMKVFWADDPEGKENKEKRKIIYIPQSYLNKLSDEIQEKTEIDDLIKEALFSKNTTIKEAHDKLLQKMKEYKKDTGKKIIDLISKYEEYQNLEKEIGNIGTKAGINKEIEKLEEEHLSEDNYSSENIEEYEKISLNLNKLKQDKKDLELARDIISKIEIIVEPKRLDLHILEKFKTEVEDYQKNKITTANKDWEEKKGEIIKTIENKISCAEDGINESTKQLKPLEEKINNNKAITELTTKLQNERNKLENFKQKETQLNECKKNIGSIISDLADSKERYKKEYESYAKEVNNELNKVKTDNVNFIVKFPFRKDAFIEKLQSIFNNKNADLKKLIDDDFEESKYTKKLLKQLADLALNNSQIIKAGNKPEDALREIFNDWYNVLHSVKMDNDKINEMSPGKKALVLLKVLIDLTETKCPILIDQPEDDLDNRSIYQDLCKYIKSKKKERQIIIVTHNANLVLCCDAEEVIVANQGGNGCKNKKDKFEYRSGSIENDTPIYADNNKIYAGILNEKGIQQHICEILEGGEVAFKNRENKYNIKN